MRVRCHHSSRNRGLRRIGRRQRWYRLGTRAMHFRREHSRGQEDRLRRHQRPQNLKRSSPSRTRSLARPDKRRRRLPLAGPPTRNEPLHPRIRALRWPGANRMPALISRRRQEMQRTSIRHGRHQPPQPHHQRPELQYANRNATRVLPPAATIASRTALGNGQRRPRPLRFQIRRRQTTALARHR